MVIASELRMLTTIMLPDSFSSVYRFICIVESVIITGIIDADIYITSTIYEISSCCNPWLICATTLPGITFILTLVFMGLVFVVGVTDMVVCLLDAIF